MNIPEEAISKAADAIYEENFHSDSGSDLARAALEAAAPILLKDMRPMSLVEIEERDNPELMKAARKRARAESKAYRAEQIREAKAAAWEEGHADARSYYSGGQKLRNPYGEVD